MVDFISCINIINKNMNLCDIEEKLILDIIDSCLDNKTFIDKFYDIMGVSDKIVKITLKNLKRFQTFSIFSLDELLQIEKLLIISDKLRSISIILSSTKVISGFYDISVIIEQLNHLYLDLSLINLRKSF